MTEVLVTIEHEIPYTDLMKFTDLSEQLSKSVQETIEMCMFEKRDEYLEQFKTNVPLDEQQHKEEDDINSERTQQQQHQDSTDRVEKRIKATTVFNKAS